MPSAGLPWTSPPVRRHHQAVPGATRHAGGRHRRRNQQSQSQQRRAQDAERSLHGNLLAADRTLTLNTDFVNIQQNIPFLDTYARGPAAGWSGRGLVRPAAARMRR